jgi:GGDEF domain-containing protein
VIVVSVPQAASQRKLAQEWIGRVRGQLRAADLAGQLVSGEIGILLPETSMSGAHSVAQRVKQFIRSNAAIGPDLAIGVACRPVGPWSPQSLLGSARAATASAEARPPASG